MEGSGAVYRLAADADLVFVAAHDTRTLPGGQRRLLALDAGTGAERWSYTFPAHSLSAPFIDATSVYVSASNGLLYALDRHTQQLRWQTQHPSWGPDAPAVGDDLVVVGGRGELLIAYDATTGSERWRFAGEHRFIHTPQICAGLVVVVCWDGYLYALDSRTGQLVWKRRGERGQGFTAPPAVGKDVTLIGSRVNPRDGKHDSPHYALLAFRTADGAQIWRYDIAAPLSVAPLLVDDMLLAALSDGTLVVLSTRDGSQRWQAAIGGTLVSCPLPAGSLLLLAASDGTCHAVRWRTDMQVELLAPELYAARGDIERAALAYALRSDYAKAAALYERLPGRSRAAASLYGRAGQLARAAELWERAGDLRRAAELYVRASQGERARKLWEQLDEWDRVVENLIDEHRLEEAARQLEQLGKPERAAQLFEQANLLEDALRLRMKLGHWDHVAGLTMRMGLFDQAAAAFLQTGQFSAAADAFERAAQRLAADPTGEQRAIECYERALQLYTDLNDDDRARACRQQVQRLRRLPNLTITGGVQETFVEYEWGALRLRVENIGYGLARAITITVGGRFETDRPLVSISALSFGRYHEQDLLIRPKREERGRTVPLELTARYQDQHGTWHEAQQVLPIRVDRQDTTPSRGIAIPPELAQWLSPQPSDATSLQQRLLLSRANLGQLLTQKTGYGSLRTPIDLLNEIKGTRREIAYIKGALRKLNCFVDDHPDDDDPGL
ncbi:MAG: hypothetical protein OHK0022_21410 [Roseiflexaceae bacterium]